MTRVGIMSDSHGLVPSQIYSFFEDVDLILHAGDIGTSEVLSELQAYKKTIAVCGNIDSKYEFVSIKDTEIFFIEQVKIFLTHIGGYPSRYALGIKKYLQIQKPDAFICGHSHICKVMFDDELKLLHINPGACGRRGIHTKCTLIKLEIDGARMKNLDVLEYDK